ncbi:MAG TPA: helix-turn-helix transcriptional regulator [Devosia sp.]|nr:helix-turn-helix transcriptional regulator [Devosia sp.]
MLQGPITGPEHWLGAGRVHAPTHIHQPNLDAELLALLCPDWRPPMLVLNADTLEVAYANIRALDAAKRRYPFAFRQGLLELGSREDSQRLRAALIRVLDTDLSTCTIIVDDPQFGPTYGLRLCLPQGFMREVLERRVENGNRLVVVEVTTGRLSLSGEDLASLGAAFGLTAAETQILAHLAEGLSLSEIAAIRRVGIETVRHQCKRLLDKTRSRRQSDLVKLVVALCAHEGEVAAA